MPIAIRHNLPPCGPLSIQTSTNAQWQDNVWVTNTGAVLEPTLVQNLTEQLYRAAVHTSAPGTKGHGLGLSIVAAIVERYQGTLELIAVPTGGLSVYPRRTNIPSGPRMGAFCPGE